MNNSNKINLFFQNYLSTISFILFWYLFYTNIPYYLNYNKAGYKGFLYNNFGLFNGFNIDSTTIFIIIILLYVILLIPYYIKYPSKSKALIIYEYIDKKIHNFSYKINKKEKTAILAWIVKLFYAPLMIFWVSGHIFTLINNIYYSYNSLWLNISFLDYFNRNLFRLWFTFILFFDVIFFTLWYLIETPFLKNQIKSVDSTLLWWFVAIICYPPFNSYVTNLWWINSKLKNFIWWYSTEFPKFSDPYIHIALNSAILILMWIYAWASVSLGFKASNLTNRWIVSKWPYKYIRHPAYICKNLSWWIGAIPMIIYFANKDNFSDIDKFEKISLVFISLIWWTFIYFLRAITEEKHLSQDEDYLKYKKKVKYKFIPWIY